MLSDALIDRAARRFKALSEPARLRLLHVLHAEGEQTVQALVAATGVRQASVSKHLAVLADAELVDRRRESPYVHYCLTDPTLPALLLLAGSRFSDAA